MLPALLSVLCSTLFAAAPPVTACPLATTLKLTAICATTSHVPDARWLDAGTRHVPVNRAPQAGDTTPEYARWGKIAVDRTATRYPNARVVDYLHVGRRTLSETRAVERFKLWLRGGGKEFGVYVDVTFNPKTEQLISVVFHKTAH
ncbi:YqzG/YhdC family protein [Alicyclobacillus shizuokensis]|uniref:YqzG/YhdC family protein n=1 Tax=Alicyclobacillus shizuokensis TaxID=392014 RepID=UPI000834D054|nr:YqzG/YhdC family protein [Alicyclobacillus shizuokensis]